MESRRQRKKNQTRAALLDAARVLFGERGINGTRIEDITERVDLGKGAFYNYFESKDALVAELAAAGIDVFESDYLVRLNGSTSAGERIAALVSLHEAFFDDHPQFELLFYQARGLLQRRDASPSLRDVFRRYLHGVGRALAPVADADPLPGLLDLSAAVAGSIAGYRSFRRAAGVTEPAGNVAEILARGIPELLARRRRTR